MSAPSLDAWLAEDDRRSADAVRCYRGVHQIRICDEHFHECRGEGSTGEAAFADAWRRLQSAHWGEVA